MALADWIDLEIDTPAALPNLGFYKFLLHLSQIFFAFLTFCTIVSVIATENYYNGSSQAAPNYTLVVTVLSLFVAAALALFPWTRFKNNNRWPSAIRNFFLRPRTHLIFTCFFSLAWFVAMISITIHANHTSNCTLDTKLQNSDPNYVGTWTRQCNSAKAAAAFSWFSFFAWITTAVHSAILLWHEKKLKHAETSAVPKATEVSLPGSGLDSRYDEDARTIVDMEYSEKDKQPLAHYDSMSSEDMSKPQHGQQDLPLVVDNSPAAVAHPLPIPPSAPPMNASDFSSSYFANSTLETSFPYGAATPSAMNLASSHTPSSHLMNNGSSVGGSPYAAPAFVTSPYPAAANSFYSSPPLYQYQAYTEQQQPFTPPYNSSSPSTMEQSYTPIAYQSSPLAYTSPSVTQQQQHYYQSTEASYPPQQQRRQ